jgi:hypothetical protein
VGWKKLGMELDEGMKQWEQARIVGFFGVDGMGIAEVAGLQKCDWVGSEESKMDKGDDWGEESKNKEVDEEREVVSFEWQTKGHIVI